LSFCCLIQVKNPINFKNLLLLQIFTKIYTIYFSGTQQTSSFGNAGPPPQTPTLKKSATTGFSLDGNKYYQQQASPTDSFSIHNTIPEYSAAKGGDLGGLTMMTLSSSRQQPAATSTIAAAQVGQIPLNKKSVSKILLQ
jgi:hypothetical protein